jgi:hypothetical protein
MFKLSDKPSKEEYIAHKDETVLLGKTEVKVILERRDTKSGSWERGFKFGSITYGLLRRMTKQKSPWSKKIVELPEYSADHGATWHPDGRTALKSKGKIVVERSKPYGEFAFSAIQRINREYDPNYKWKP